MAAILKRVVGHRAVVRSLFESHTRNRLPSTLLFSGPTGVGKRLVALALAQRLVCETASDSTFDACGDCGACLRIEKGQSESLLLVAPEGGSIKIERARDIGQFTALRKLGRARIIIVDQAQLLNPQTANALLKSLEEPPSGTYFILIAPIADGVLPTIRSRAQLARFGALSDEEMKAILGAGTDPWVIESAHGSLEVATRLVENSEDFAELEAATADFMAASLERFPADECARLRELTKEREAQAHASALMNSVLLSGLRMQAGLGARAGTRAPWTEIATTISRLPARSLSRLTEISLKLEQDMARNVDRGLLFENFAIQLKSARSNGLD